MSARIGVIACGGRGSRMRRTGIQKCLIPVGGKPILEYSIEALIGANIKTIFLLTGFLREQVDDYLARRWKGSRTCVLASVFGGTVGEVAALQKAQAALEEEFIYAGGDSIFTQATLQGLVETANQDKTSVAAIAVTEKTEVAPKHPGILISAVTGRVKSVVVAERRWKKARTALVGMGLYYFRPEIFLYLSKLRTRRPMIEESFRHVINDGKTVAAFISKDPWFCLHSETDLRSWRGV